MHSLFICLVLIYSISVCLGHDVSSFDDAVLFDIHWPGKELLGQELIGEKMTVTSSRQEKYQCTLPKVEVKEAETVDKYEGPPALALLTPLFNPKSCSYRLESYWTYEVCHGRFIRQYHEDREGKKVKLQEYMLGMWDEAEFARRMEEAVEVEKDKNYRVPMKKIDNSNLPYVEVTMGNGTLCDLNENKPRQTKVLYACYAHGKHEIYSLKETSTCQYEVIILSHLLCEHPRYKPKESGENVISCLPVENSSKKPYDLVKLQVESAKLRRQYGADQIRVEFISPDFSEPPEEEATSSPLDVSRPKDSSPVRNFLEGKNCLTGGTGWWKYEFCYGKSVQQYHQHKHGGKSVIKLGTFNEQNHLDWIKQHPHKRPKLMAKRTHLSHFYSDGTICDKTGKPRQTEVKLKCDVNNNNLNEVSLYLLEPKYCEYILGVESPLVCEILALADENGLVNINEDNFSQKDESPANIQS